MSILIKGVEMPTDCAMLLKIFPDGNVGVPVHLNLVGTMVLKDAEAVPVPKHGRLIDADALFDFILNIYKVAQGDARKAYRDVLDTIVAAGDVIEAEEGE